MAARWWLGHTAPNPVISIFRHFPGGQRARMLFEWASVLQASGGWRKRGEDMPTLTVDGRPVAVRDGANVLQAARLAGIHLPTLCHWEGLPPYGVCRLCLERSGRRGQAAAGLAAAHLSGRRRP